MECVNGPIQATACVPEASRPPLRSLPPGGRASIVAQMSSPSSLGDPVPALPPTSPELALAGTRPYFLWWTDATVGELRARLLDPDPDVRAYWMGALLREANTRDVWLYVRPDDIRRLWPRLLRHLGRARDMWAFLLALPQPEWPPRQARAWVGHGRT